MTAAQQTSTHEIDIQGEVVTKRYRSWDRREPHREWAALTLLAEHAPGLSPAPISADLDGTPPTVTMSRLPGTPLRGLHANPHVVEAMAATLTHLHRDVPAGEELAYAAWNPDAALALVQSRAAAKPDLGDDPEVRRAFAEGVSWLAAAGRTSDRLRAGATPPVLGLADGNLANYLWDPETARVRLLDWEDSGRADRAFELAEVAEHISHVDGDLDSDLLVDLLVPEPAEKARVREFRRLLALGWLLILGPGGPSATRNPPGTLERQAGRVLALLDS
ncbi:aminoglycoside phosphotransferase family protein [Nonomuraea sp. NPDC050404]|uniref:aminoglycoside phosphotransferase family protein n=1 Tax=Nonomuraea sp. NPDC050404 TaxID=3155783 RepID=UPI0033DD5287